MRFSLIKKNGSYQIRKVRAREEGVRGGYLLREVLEVRVVVKGGIGFFLQNGVTCMNKYWFHMYSVEVGQFL